MKMCVVDSWSTDTTSLFPDNILTWNKHYKGSQLDAFYYLEFKLCYLKMSLGDFALKDAKLGSYICISKNRFDRNKISCAEDNSNCMRNMCAK